MRVDGLEGTLVHGLEAMNGGDVKDRDNTVRYFDRKPVQDAEADLRRMLLHCRRDEDDATLMHVAPRA